MQGSKKLLFILFLIVSFVSFSFNQFVLVVGDLSCSILPYLLKLCSILCCSRRIHLAQSCFELERTRTDSVAAGCETSRDG